MQIAMPFATHLKPNHLRLLLRIAETGQLQRAAAMTAVSQPAASRVLAEIEGQAGAPLFDRHAKGMEPTELGSIYIRHAKVILEEFDALQFETRRQTAGEIGHIRVGAVTGPAVGVLMPAIREAKAETPDVEITIEVGPSTELVRGLVEGRFDFIISRLPSDYDSRDFRMHPARSEIVSLVVRPEHPLAGRRAVSLETLTEFEWVIQEIGSPIRQAVEAAFLSRGQDTPGKVTNSSSLLMVLAMLESTDVIAPLASEVADMLSKGPIRANLVTLDLETPISVSPCFIIQGRFRKLAGGPQRLIEAVFRHL
jgi:DNA-binding transcriptional LysR family regulator